MRHRSRAHRPSTFAAWSSATATSRPSTTSRCASKRASSLDFSGPTAPARRRRSMRSSVSRAEAPARYPILGHDNETQWREARRFVGLSPQEYNFDRYLSIRDVLILRGRLFRTARSGRQRSRRHAARAIRAYLEGQGRIHAALRRQKRRLTLARALIHRAEAADSRRADRRRRRRVAARTVGPAARAQRRRADDLSDDALFGRSRRTLQTDRDHSRGPHRRREADARARRRRVRRCKTSFWS